MAILSKPMAISRRGALTYGIGSPLVTLLGCRPAEKKEALTPPLVLNEQHFLYQESLIRMRVKFGRFNGAELVVDAMKGDELFAVKFYTIPVEYEFYGSAVQTLNNRATMSRGGGIPERLRIEWRETDEWGRTKDDVPLYVGKIIGNEIVEVGSRIPQEVIDSLQRDPKGEIRLKFRMSQKGTLFGWDIERRPGYERGGSHVDAVHELPGGDFRESNGRGENSVRKGWYIDKETGKKVETDF
jgi:hypothetical protein